MLDFHTHILPDFDDGSESINQSCEMLEMLRNDGVDTVFATPHYYSKYSSIETFLQKRQESYDTIKSKIKSAKYPKIHLGAEVLLTDELILMKDLDRLCIEGTDYLLLEMPFTSWNDSLLRLLEHILASYSIIPVIAHIDRYIFEQNFENICGLFDMDILIQCNTESILNKKTRRHILKMIKDNHIHFIGSDCHNTTTRPPNFGETLKILNKKLTKYEIEALFEF